MAARTQKALAPAQRAHDPLLHRRRSPGTRAGLVALLLVGAAVVTGLVGETFNQYAYLAIGFLMYLSRQAAAISVTTILQEEVEDTYRGRVFAFYDMMYNATYVAGAALFAALMPANGKSPVILAVIAIGFLVVATAYWLSVRGSTGSPSAAAQRSSS